MPSAPLVLKSIAGGIRKSSGCQKPITSVVGGFISDDKHFCFGRFEAKKGQWSATKMDAYVVC